MLEVPGVMVVGSQVPNLLQASVAATLVVSQDLDVGVPVERHTELKSRLGDVGEFESSTEEPSVWVGRTAGLLELNFVGIDRTLTPTEAYLLEDDRLPMLVFGGLSLLSSGAKIEVEGTVVSLPRPAGLLLEKLVTDRTGEKGERDLLVALGVLAISSAADFDEFVNLYRRLAADRRWAVRSNLTVLSLLSPHPGLPDPRSRRAEVAALLRRLEEGESEVT